MAELIFFDKGHEYQLNGVTIPSVSELTRFISREVYGTVGQYTLDHAADRGTRVHKLTEALDKYGSCECDPDVVGYINAYVKFRKDHKPEWDKIECSFNHPDGLYAGTIDRRGVVGGKRAIVDLKSSCAVQKPLYGAQLNLYRMMMPNYGVEAQYILHLKADGAYKLIDIPIDDSVANACITLHYATAKKSRKKEKVNA